MNKKNKFMLCTAFILMCVISGGCSNDSGYDDVGFRLVRTYEY